MYNSCATYEISKSSNCAAKSLKISQLKLYNCNSSSASNILESFSNKSIDIPLNISPKFSFTSFRE